MQRHRRGTALCLGKRLRPAISAAAIAAPGAQLRSMRPPTGNNSRPGARQRCPGMAMMAWLQQGA